MKAPAEALLASGGGVESRLVGNAAALIAGPRERVFVAQPFHTGRRPGQDAVRGARLASAGRALIMNEAGAGHHAEISPGQRERKVRVAHCF
jgi:hypothetical protein